MISLFTDNPARRFAEEMKRTPQSSRWHGEGDVFTHSEMVADALGDVPGFGNLTERQKEILTVAAWLHDIGKIARTRVVGEDIEAPGHSSAGSRMARREMWLNHGFCGDRDLVNFREAVALLIRYHSFPPHAIDAPDARVRLHSIAANGLLVPDFSIKLLCMLGRADMTGRIADDRDEMLDQIALCEELAKEEGCYEAPYPFASKLTRRAYLSGKDVWKDQKLHDSTWGPVYLMSGLPGTGKDTWIQRNLEGYPVVSLDDIREKLKISPTDNQGYVANLAKEKAREYLRLRRPFVWNATDITQPMRRQLVALFEEYDAQVHIIYLEAGLERVLRQNSGREAMVPQGVIESMIGKITPPEAHEAYSVEWITSH